MGVVFTLTQYEDLSGSFGLLFVLGNSFIIVKDNEAKQFLRVRRGFRDKFRKISWKVPIGQKTLEQTCHSNDKSKLCHTYEKFAESGENNENYGEAMFRGHNKEAVQKQYESLSRECHFNIFKNCYKKGADCTCNQEMESYLENPTATDSFGLFGGVSSATTATPSGIRK